MGPLLLFTGDTLTHLYILETRSATGSWVCLFACSMERAYSTVYIRSNLSPSLKQPWLSISRIQSSPLMQGNTHPTFPSSQARNFSATDGCRHLVTTATQPTLKPNQKNNTLSLRDTLFFLPPFGSFFEWFSNNLEQKIKELEWSAQGRQNSNWELFPF